MRVRWLGIGSLFVVLACGQNGGFVPDDAGVSGPEDDAGTKEDGGLTDAGEPDAGDPDAGTLDAGTEDSGVPDAGPTDAGAGIDAGSKDAGLPPVDPCTGKVTACPSLTANEGAGLRAIDRCAFPMAPAAGFGGNSALLAALAQRTLPATVSQVVADANRIATASTTVPGGPPGLAYAFRWNAEDEASTTWVPQGLTGSADGDPTGLVGGKRIILASFYEDTALAKGVRIAFVDITNPAAPRYRFALLVEPSGTVAAPSFIPVNAHAGGIVWFGTRLYVAATGSGFRVFDLSRMMEVATDVDTIGCTATTCRAGLYKYVIPQIGAYVDKSTCAPIFSWVSLDRTSTPPALISGEYCSTAACTGPLAGRMFRWPLDPTTGLLRGPTTTWPLEAFVMGQRQVQGGAVRGKITYLSSSAPAGGAGELYCLNPVRSLTADFSDTPEDLMVDGKNAVLWSQSEAPNARVVFSVRFASYPIP
jgi:hypothetical protein